MKKATDLIVRYRVVVLALLLVFTLLLGYQATKIGFNADFSTYLQESDPLVKQFNHIGELFAGKSIVMVLIERDNVFSNESLNLIGDLTEAYESAAGVSHVTSLTNVLDFRKTEWGLDVGELIQNGKIPQERGDLEQLEKYVMSKDMYVGDLVSGDGKATIIVLRISSGADEAEVVRNLRHLTEKIAPSMEGISFGGMPALMDSMTLLISENMNVLLPIMIFLILGVLGLSFRKPGGIFLPLAIVGVAAIFTLGLMSLLGLSIDMLSGIMPVILIAMGSADGIHFMKRYYELRKTGNMPREAVRETLAEMWKPMLVTTITSMVGFMSLVISQFSVITQFGLVTALGLFLALVTTFTLLPAVLGFSRAGLNVSQKSSAKTGNSYMEKLGELIYEYKFIILSLGAVIALISAIGIPRINKDVDWSLCLEKGGKPYHAEMLLRDKFGGSLPIQILVKGDINDPAALKSMRIIERYLQTVPLVSETQSIASIISEMNDALNDRYIVPESREGVANLWLLIEGESMLEQMVTSDKDQALIQGKFATMDTKPLVLALEKIERFIGEFPRTLEVFDLNEIPSQYRQDFMELRRRNIARNLLWDLQRRGVDVDDREIQEVLDSALSDSLLTQDNKSAAAENIANYLQGEESEIEIASESRAEAVAEKLAETIDEVDHNSISRISDALESSIKGYSKEDINYLAESLDMVISQTVGEIRVRSALQKLEENLGIEFGKYRDLYKDVKGDLWEMNEKYMVTSADSFNEIVGNADQVKARKVQIAISNAGLAPVLHSMEKALAPSQTYSLLIALIFVFLLLWLILRSLVASIVSVIPLILTIILNFAVMAYFDIGLDSFTSMIASIAIGLGIDYTIHFNSRFRRELSVLKNEKLALKKTLGTTGVAIITNALTVGLGFSVLLLAGGQHVRRFGGLTSLTMISSALFTLTVMPALMLVLRPKYLRKEVKG